MIINSLTFLINIIMIPVNNIRLLIAPTVTKGSCSISFDKITDTVSPREIILRVGFKVH